MMEVDSIPTLIGNPAVKATLDLLQERGIPPVLLFEGAAGVGKKLFAKKLIMNALGYDERVLNDLHPDVLSLDHQVEKIRELLQNVSSFPFESPYRFYLIDRVDEMLPVHANALLKTFEEAPDFNRFILFATHIDRVMPTILSRAMPIHFFPISDQEIQSYLVNELKISSEMAVKVGQLAKGSLGKAKALVDEGFLEYYPIVLNALKYHLTRDYLRFYETLDEIQNFKDNQTTEELLTVLEQWLLDLYTLKNRGERPLFFPEERENLEKCSEVISINSGHLLMLFQNGKEALLRHMRLARCIEYILLSLS